MRTFYIKCPCNHCNSNTEFPSHALGQKIACPHCGNETELFDPFLLPLFEGEEYRKIKIKISTEPKPYFVNLEDYSCNCPDFIERRSHVPLRCMLRMCPHICEALYKKYRRKLSPFMEGIVWQGSTYKRGVSSGCIREDDFGNLIFILDQTTPEWVNVFGPMRRKAKTYEKFGYNRILKYWSYGRKPLISMPFEEFLAAEKDTDYRLSF